MASIILKRIALVFENETCLNDYYGEDYYIKFNIYREGASFNKFRNIIKYIKRNGFFDGCNIVVFDINGILREEELLKVANIYIELVMEYPNKEFLILNTDLENVIKILVNDCNNFLSNQIKFE
jgi:hypothetical protein